MFALKGYQERALETLAGFLAEARDNRNEQGIAAAFNSALRKQEQPGVPYRSYNFDDVPYVCIRIPTGGGKTVLASHSIVTAAREFVNKDFPIALWLVPSTTIRKQTVEALKTAGHPYREHLDHIYRQQVLVLDIDEVTSIRPQDIGSKAIVVVSTIQNLRVNDTSGRKVYAYHENFEPHFSSLPASTIESALLETVRVEDLQDNGLSKRELGKVKYSFANLLALHNPIVIVDEAHNARSALSFDMLRRIHPATIIEFTATPDTSNSSASNVLFNVSAAELKAEEMIKLPIMLAEEPQGWQQAVADAVTNRKRLADAALNDKDYIRPIALYQAEPKNGSVTVEVLKAYLVDELKIDPQSIAIATGSQRELDNVKLFATDCSIEHIITIEALKEGWDCPFAYVFCSVKQVSSSKDAEQLLGRVLRMPYARRRVIEDLNRAYAHLATSSFAKAARDLKDKLIAMGFEELDIAEYLRQYQGEGGQGELFGEKKELSQIPPRSQEVVVEVASMPQLAELSEAEQQQLTTTTSDEGIVVVRVRGEVSETLRKVLVKSAGPGKARKAVEQDLRIHNMRIEAARAPAEQGATFGKLPLLCAHIQGELELIDPETVLEAGLWSLLDYPAQLPRFRAQETSNLWEIDIDGETVGYSLAEPVASYDLNHTLLDVTEADLVRWLDRELRQPDVPQLQLNKFIGLVIRNLQASQPELTLTALVRNKFPLKRAIGDLIARHRREAQAKGYQKALFSDESVIEPDADFMCEFTPEHYPAKGPFYRGSYKFTKHFYGNDRIEDLKASGEEFDCAQVIDTLPQVKYWIRNLVRRERGSFWMPLAHSKFYPDFIAELKDGRMLVVEYKGDTYATNDDSREKNRVGQIWAETGGDNYLFLMAVDKKTDPRGRDVSTQILDLIEC